MFTVDEDLTLHITRGDSGEATISAVVVKEDGTTEPFTFHAGDVLRLKVFEKKNCENVVLQKDFGVEDDTQEATISLEGSETKIGEIINKPVVYWYELELNPFSVPQTIIGYDEDGARMFKLYPEGKDGEAVQPTPEEVGHVDAKLSLTSQNAIQNQAVARELLNISAVKEKNKNSTIKFWIGTKAEYEATEKKENNCLHIITDDTKELWNGDFNTLGSCSENPKTFTQIANILNYKQILVEVGGEGLLSTISNGYVNHTAGAKININKFIIPCYLSEDPSSSSGGKIFNGSISSGGAYNLTDVDINDIDIQEPVSNIGSVLRSFVGINVDTAGNLSTTKCFRIKTDFSGVSNQIVTGLHIYKIFGVC